MRSLACALAILAVFVCAACNKSDSRQAAIPATTLTAPSLQPPTQGPDIDPKVTFDPCTMISDDAVLETGYDPASRKRYSGFAQPPNISLGCEFKDDEHGPINPRYVLDIASTNQDINRYRDSLTKALSAQQSIRSITVNTRAGFQLADTAYFKCYVHIPTKTGEVVIMRTNAEVLPDPCSGILDTARMIEATIGANN